MRHNRRTIGIALNLSSASFPGFSRCDDVIAKEASSPFGNARVTCCPSKKVLTSYDNGLTIIGFGPDSASNSKIISSAVGSVVVVVSFRELTKSEIRAVAVIDSDPLRRSIYTVVGVGEVDEWESTIEAAWEAGNKPSVVEYIHRSPYPIEPVKHPEETPTSASIETDVEVEESDIQQSE